MDVATVKAQASGRINDPEGTKRNIIEIATKEFAENGLSGARIDEIAAKTKSSKRMIYYYFGDKDGLYLKVLEDAYSRVRAIEAALDLDAMAPLDALRRLVEFTFDHHNSHEPFIRLVMIENIHHARHIKRSRAIQSVNTTVIEAIERLYVRGRAARLFRPGLDAIDLHMTISALCFFNVSNRATFSKIFSRDLKSKEALAHLRAQTVEMIERFARAP